MLIRGTFVQLQLLWIVSNRELILSESIDECLQQSLSQNMCQTTHILSKIFSRADISEQCIFKIFESDKSKECHIFSEIIAKQIRSTPHSQQWAQCKYCSLVGNKWHTYNSNASACIGNGCRNAIKIDLSFSMWRDFFHKFHNDLFSAISLPSAKTDLSTQIKFYVDRPVFILPIIAFHVGHILIDVIEQIYSAMHSEYGRVRHDALIVLDVANDDEKGVLGEKIARYVHENDNSAYILLKLFSDLPVMSLDDFNSIQVLGNGILFRSLHIGLDVSQSHFNAGFRYHPCLVDICRNRELADRAMRFRSFQTFVNQAITISSGSDNYLTSSIVFIQRKNSRVILNLAELYTSVIESFHIKGPLIVDLEEESFWNQLSIFRSARLLIAAAGTGLHNMIFLTERPAAVIILMQPGWCRWAWNYANQAIFLGIKPLIYCGEGLFSNSICFASSGWKEGPTVLKSANITVDKSAFLSLFSLALQHIDSTDVADCVFDVNSFEFEDKFEASMDSSCMKTQKRENIDSIDYLSTASSHYNSHPNAREVNVELFVSSVSISHESVAQDVELWSFKFTLEMVLRPELAQFADSFFAALGQYLSLCSSILSYEDDDSFEYTLGDPQCREISMFNYYATFNFESLKLFHSIHFWLQTSRSGGKLLGSDAYVSVNGQLSPSTSLFSNYNENVTFDITYYIEGSKVQIHYNYQCLSDESLKLLLHRNHQRYFKRLCEQYDLYPNRCIFIRYPIMKAMHREINRRRNRGPMSAVQYLPSPENPFVFLHIEKSAGTSLRQSIVASAEKNHLEYYVPCYGDLHCTNFDIHNCSVSSALDDCTTKLKNISVVAGHFYYKIWHRLPTQRLASCMVVGRHPVSRVISYYYERCFNSSGCLGYNRRINDLTVDELLHLVKYFRQAKYREDNETLIITDEGMSDNACRYMTGSKTTSGVILDKSFTLNIPEPLSLEQTEEAVYNVDNCIIGLREEWESSKIIFQHWFPWLDLSKDYKKMRLYSGLETINTLRHELRSIIESNNKCDMKLHDYMVTRFHEQLKVMRHV